MSYPTGMGPATGIHYNQVAAQMNAYLHKGHGKKLHPVGNRIHQAQVYRQPAFASRIGVDPVISTDYGQFARKFMRHLLS